jgi:hypothetical protein
MSNVAPVPAEQMSDANGATLDASLAYKHIKRN